MLKSLYLSEFTAFEELDLEFSPGINVFIGENGTGKTHAMKAAYAVLRAAESSVAEAALSEAARGDALRKSLREVFRPAEGRVERLLRRERSDEGVTRLEVKTDASTVRVALIGESRSPAPLQIELWNFTQGLPSLFIPTHDMLAAYEGFLANYQKYETSFERTYADYCLALGGELLREDMTEGWTPAQRRGLLEQLRTLIGGAPRLEANRFYLEMGGVKLEAHLAAEGLRKIAGLYQVIANGALRRGTVLFWDEPETNLNPRLISKVALILRALAQAGVQVFLTTHDFLLSRRLSRQEGETRFFSFWRDSATGLVVAKSGERLADIQHNPIIAEYSRAFDDEMDEEA